MLFLETSFQTETNEADRKLPEVIFILTLSVNVAVYPLVPENSP